MSLVMPNYILVYAQQQNNLTDEEISIIIEDLLKESAAQNPEGAKLTKKVDQTEEAR
jgi:hypothetical protein